MPSLELRRSPLILLCGAALATACPAPEEIVPPPMTGVDGGTTDSGTPGPQCPEIAPIALTALVNPPGGETPYLGPLAWTATGGPWEVGLYYEQCGGLRVDGWPQVTTTARVETGRLPTAGVYAWRVRPVAAEGCPAIAYSPCVTFSVTTGSGPGVDHAIGGVVSGLVGTVSLSLDGGAPLALSQNGAFVFGARVADGASYRVDIREQPATQTCVLEGGAGTARADVQVRVACGGVAPGDPQLDPTFGTGGVARLDGRAGAVALDGQGRLITALSGASGAVALTRWTTDGARDAAFGTGGTLQARFGGAGSRSTVGGVALDGQGRIVVAGAVESRAPTLGVLRALADGSALDRSFASTSSGAITVPIGYEDAEARGVVILSDGRIAAGVATKDPSEDDTYGVAMFTAAGAIDTTFAGSGQRLISPAFGKAELTGIARGAGDRIYLVGTVEDARYEDAVGVVALTPLGEPDTTFAPGGFVSSAFTGARAGRTKAGAAYFDEATGALRVAASADDDTFGAVLGLAGDGRVVLEAFTPLLGEAAGVAAARAPDGKIVLVGTVKYDGSGEDELEGMFVARFAADGTLDATFGAAGWMTGTFGYHKLEPFQVVVQASGRIVVLAEADGEPAALLLGISAP